MKKKVLFLLEGFDKGGIEQVTLDIVNNLDPQKYDITVQTFWYGGHCQSLVNPNIKVKPFFFKRYVPGIIRLIQYLSPKILYRLFVHGDYDIEIAASDGGAAKVISGSTNKKAKKICWVHMDVKDQGSKLKEYNSKEKANRIYSAFDKIFCVSENTKKSFIERFGFEEKVFSLHNPLPTESIIKKSQEEIAFNFEPDCFNIVAVGSLVQVKGFDRLIKACGKLQKDDKLNIHLYIAGSGPLESELRSLIETEKITNVSLIGFCSNPYPLIKNASIFVCSSLSESFSLVIGESFILQTPILGTRCSGVCEWIESDHSGYIVDNNETALYEGLKAIVEDSFLYNSLKEKAVQKSKTIDFCFGLSNWEKIMLKEDIN